jgi:hypothetical protein
MRKFTFVVSALLFSLFLHAQQQPDYASIKLDTKEDYTEDVDKAALQASTFLLTTSLEGEAASRQQAAQFLVRWMSGTPTYTFEIDETATKISKVKEELMVTYLAAMVKYSIENPTERSNATKVKVNTVKAVLEYCKQYSIKTTGELKKLQQSHERGELEKYLSK